MHSERDKFLYKQMGIEATYLLGDYRTQLDQKARKMNGFSSWLEFGLLWEWSKKQNWWLNYVSMTCIDYDSFETLTNLETLINPDKFANSIYEFLKAKV